MVHHTTIEPKTLDGSRRTNSVAAPAVGQHTGVVLRELGYTDEQVAESRRARTPQRLQFRRYIRFAPPPERRESGAVAAIAQTRPAGPRTSARGMGRTAGRPSRTVRYSHRIPRNCESRAIHPSCELVTHRSPGSRPQYAKTRDSLEPTPFPLRAGSWCRLPLCAPGSTPRSARRGCTSTARSRAG